MTPKRVIFASILVIALMTLSCFTTYFIVNGNQQDIVDIKDYSEFTYLPKITHDEFKDKVNSGEEFFVYIGRPDCGDSRKFHQEFEELFVEFNNDGTVSDIKYDLDDNIYYFDISEIIDSTASTQAREEYRKEYGFYFTPSLVAYKDADDNGVSEIDNMAEWSAVYGFSITDYMKWFYDNELIIPTEKLLHEGESIKSVE